MSKQFMLPLNIQLFAEGAEPIDVSVEFVEPQPTTEPTGVIDEPAESVEPQPTSEPVKPVQSTEDNAKFAAARRKAEAENQRLLQVLNKFGYQGTPQEIADLLEAEQTQKSVEQVRAEREAFEQKTANEQQTQQELNHYRNIAMQSMVKEGIDKINKAYPEAKIKDIKDLGEPFIRLISAGLDEVEAYEVMQARKVKEEIPKPQITGPVNSQTVQEKDIYTADEVRQMSQSEVKKNFEKIQKSMKTWKK